VGWPRLEEAANWRGRLLRKRSLLGDFGARIQDGYGELRAPLIGSSVHGGQGFKGHLAGANGAAYEENTVSVGMASGQGALALGLALAVVRTGRQCHVVPARLDVGVAHQSKENVRGNGRGLEHLGKQVDLRTWSASAGEGGAGGLGRVASTAWNTFSCSAHGGSRAASMSWCRHNGRTAREEGSREVLCQILVDAGRPIEHSIPGPATGWAGATRNTATRASR